MSLPKITLYTDGGYSPKRGSGGWASYMVHNNHDLMLYGYDEETTNNRMEIMGVLNSLLRLTTPCQVTLYSDSQYVVNSINKWLYGWIKNNWRSSSGKEVSNKDLWIRIVELLKYHKVRAKWVRGHNGHPENELCDDLANEVQWVFGGYRK